MRRTMLLYLKFMLVRPKRQINHEVKLSSLNMSPESHDNIFPDSPWVSADPLGEVLHFLHMNGVFYTRSELTAPWGIDLPPMPDFLMFHVITSGDCWLKVEGREALLLHPGNFALVPHGQGHQLLSAPEQPAINIFDLEREQVSDRYEILRHGKGGASTNLICGAVRFDHPAAHQLMQLLPDIINIDIWRSPQMDWFQSTLRLMASEASELKPGGETIITRLADILVIQAIRSWMSEDPAAKTGWLGALQDKQIGRAIMLIQRYPDRDWTVALLADEVGMSRSSFAERFKQLVEKSPLQYVTWWRMNLATKWIKEENTSLADLADRLGYQSEAAFSRAFKKTIGFTPGTIRRNNNLAN